MGVGETKKNTPVFCRWLLVNSKYTRSRPSSPLPCLASPANATTVVGVVALPLARLPAPRCRAQIQWRGGREPTEEGRCRRGGGVGGGALGGGGRGREEREGAVGWDSERERKEGGRERKGVEENARFMIIYEESLMGFLGRIWVSPF